MKKDLQDITQKVLIEGYSNLNCKNKKIESNKDNDEHEVLIKFWETEEDRDLGESDIYKYFNISELKHAISVARDLQFNEDYASVEVQDAKTHETYYFTDGEEEEYFGIAKDLKESKKVESYSYYWKDDIEEVENTEENDELVYNIAEHMKETQPEEYKNYDVWDIASNIISIWKILKRSRLYDYLIKWYGSEQEMLKNVRDVYETRDAIYFVTGSGYSLFDADLLGGNADGRTAEAFDKFVDNGGKREEKNEGKKVKRAPLTDYRIVSFSNGKKIMLNNKHTTKDFQKAYWDANDKIKNNLKDGDDEIEITLANIDPSFDWLDLEGVNENKKVESKKLAEGFKHIDDVWEYLEQSRNEDDLEERIEEIPNKFGLFTYEVSDDGKSATVTNEYEEWGSYQEDKADIDFLDYLDENKKVESADAPLDSQAYWTYVLGYDLLQNKLKADGPECDTTFEDAWEIAGDFMNSKEYKDTSKSGYDSLVDYLKNKNLIESKKVEDVDELNKMYEAGTSELEKAFTTEVRYWLGELVAENDSDELGRRASEVLEDNTKIKSIVDELVNGSDDMWSEIHLRIEKLAGINYRDRG